MGNCLQFVFNDVYCNIDVTVVSIILYIIVATRNKQTKPICLARNIHKKSVPMLLNILFNHSATASDKIFQLFVFM